MQIDETRIIYRNPRSYCGPISMVKVLQDGALAVVFREAEWTGTVRHADPTTRTSFIRSFDGGRTWSQPIMPDPQGGNGTTLNQFADGMLLVSNYRFALVPVARRGELAGREVWELPRHGMVQALDGTFCTRSFDNGVSWEEPHLVNVPGYEAATTAGRVIELDDGSLLMPLNSFKPGNAENFPWVARSTDRGRTWSYWGTCGDAPPETPFPENRILKLPDGRILSMIRTRRGNYRRSHSADGGRTWSAMEETALPCIKSSPADLLLLNDGRVLCTYGCRGREPRGVRACVSEDGGVTWPVEQELILRDDALGADIGYPSTVQLHDGRLLSVYYWHDTEQIRHLVGTWWRLVS